MAITYSVNSNTITAGIQAKWEAIPTGDNADGTQKLSSNWLLHTWASEFMEMAEWLILLPLRGVSLTELKTTDESTPNSTATYATARLLTATGQHLGRRMANVKISFLVDVTS